MRARIYIFHYISLNILIFCPFEPDILFKDLCFRWVKESLKTLGFNLSKSLFSVWSFHHCRAEGEKFGLWIIGNTICILTGKKIHKIWSCLSGCVSFIRSQRPPGVLWPQFYLSQKTIWETYVDCNNDWSKCLLLGFVGGFALKHFIMDLGRSVYRSVLLPFFFFLQMVNLCIFKNFQCRLRYVLILLQWQVHAYLEPTLHC